MSDSIIGARTSRTRFVIRLYSSDDAASRHATVGSLFSFFNGTISSGHLEKTPTSEGGLVPAGQVSIKSAIPHFLPSVFDLLESQDHGFESRLGI